MTWSSDEYSLVWGICIKYSMFYRTIFLLEWDFVSLFKLFLWLNWAVAFIWCTCIHGFGAQPELWLYFSHSRCLKCVEADSNNSIQTLLQNRRLNAVFVCFVLRRLSSSSDAIAKGSPWYGSKLHFKLEMPWMSSQSFSNTLSLSGIESQDEWSVWDIALEHKLRSSTL